MTTHSFASVSAIEFATFALRLGYAVDSVEIRIGKRLVGLAADGQWLVKAETFGNVIGRAPGGHAENAQAPRPRRSAGRG